MVVSEPLERVLKRLAKGRSLKQCLVEELMGGLKAKRGFYGRLLIEFEEKWGMSFKEAAGRFEKDEAGDSYAEHEAYLEYSFLKGAIKELSEIKEALKMLEAHK